MGEGPPLLKGSYLFTLQNQGFDGHPGALVYVPSNFSLKSNGDGKLDVVVWVHGYDNCIQNVVRAPQAACNCSASHDIRVGYDLIAQFEDAARLGGLSNTLLVVAEVAYDQANDSPGRWKEEGMFKKFLDELLTVHMSPLLLPKASVSTLSSADISRVRIFSHSGGYYVIGNMATVGGMAAAVKELVLFDSLYTNFAQFDSFVTTNLPLFGNGAEQYRFSSLYTVSGGTANNNVAMAERANTWTDQSGQTQLLFFDNTLSVLPEDKVARYPLLFKLMNLTHDEIPQTMFREWLTQAL